VLRPTFERSLRRALRKMVDDGVVKTVGDGGPRDPARYHVDPLLLAMAGNEEDFNTLLKGLGEK